MHLAERGYFLVFLTAILAIAGAWSAEPALSSAWYLPALLLLGGLTLEGFILQRSHLHTDIETAPRALLGREQAAAFTFRNDSPRNVRIQYAPVLPVGFEPLSRTRRLVVAGR